MAFGRLSESGHESPLRASATVETPHDLGSTQLERNGLYSSARSTGQTRCRIYLRQSAAPATQSQTSVEFQALRRWQQALDTAASLGFDGRRIAWHEFLAELEHAAEDILFAAQSSDAPIQIAGPAESAGLTADALWFLGARRGIVAGGRVDASLSASLRATRIGHAPRITSTGLATFAGPSLSDCLPPHPKPTSASRCRRMKQNLDTPVLLRNSPVLRSPMQKDLLPPPHDVPISIPFADSSTIPFAGTHPRGGASRSILAIPVPIQSFRIRATSCRKLGRRTGRPERETARPDPACGSSFRLVGAPPWNQEPRRPHCD